MAMVTVVIGNKQVKMSRNAYDMYLKGKGYSLLEDEIEKLKPVDIEETEEVEESPEVEEVETIPISEMNKEQLAEYAKEHNIDTSRARNVREARQIIQKAIREQKL